MIKDKHGSFIAAEDERCPHIRCGKQYRRIVEKDADVALLECPDGHQWSVILKKT